MADGDLIFSRDDDGVTFGPPAPPAAPEKGDIKDHTRNLALLIEDTSLNAIAESLTETIAFDEDGQTPWEEIAEDVMDHLGLGPDSLPDNPEDGESADNSSHTLMLTALLRFQAKALSVMLPSDDMAVRTRPARPLDQIQDPEERDQQEETVSAAERRVQGFYTDYLFHKLPSYEEDTDQILKDMGLMGVGLRKIVTDRTRTSTPVMPEYVPPGDLIISYSTKNFRVGRYTHRMDMPTGDLIRRIQSGAYRPIKVVDQQQPEASRLAEARGKMYGVMPAHYMNTETHRIFEVCTDLFLADDEHPKLLPRNYIVTIHAHSRQVLAIQRNWDASDPDETPLEHFIAYIYHPGRNAVSGVGLGQILLQTTKALRKAQRRMLQAAYLQNHPSGFKLSTLSIREGDTKVRAGEFVDVDAPTGDIRSAIMMHPFEGPSQGLMVLSDKLDANGRELGGIASIDFAALMKSGVAAGPAMAAFEESTEFQTAVHRRLYKAHRKELQILHERMRMVLGNSTVLYGAEQALRPGDLTAVDILPYMKPGQASRQKVIMEAQAVWDLAKDNPDLLDRRKAAEKFVHALGSPDAEGLLLDDPEEAEIKPADPVTEYAVIMMGKPVRAGMLQNHQAHIDAHAAQMRMLQNSPLPVEQGEAMSAVLAAHIGEHMGMLMMSQAAAMAGVDPAQLGPDMPPELEAQIAPALAQAVMEMEAARQANDGGGERLAVEQVKGQNAMALAQVKGQTDAAIEEMRLAAAREIEAMKQRHAEQMQQMKNEHAAELQEAKDAAAMERELEDNEMALVIAKLNAGSKGAGTEVKSSA